jgi:hypothetical protein
MTDVTNSEIVVAAPPSDDEAFVQLFQAPAEIRGNAEWEAIYADQLRLLRRDAAGLPMDTAQAQLIERTATTYIRLKWYETFGGLSPAQLDKLNETYLKYVTQFQRVLQVSDETLRRELLLWMQKVAMDSVDLIPEDGLGTRQAVRRHFAENFASKGY